MSSRTLFVHDFYITPIGVAILLMLLVTALIGVVLFTQIGRRKK